jgi:hydrogenase maturation factor HypE
MKNTKFDFSAFGLKDPEENKITIDESISLLESAISRMMQFESTSDKNDFLLDVVNEYKNELANPTKRSEEFAELVKPLIKYLNEKQDPHTKIIIDCTSAEMVRGEMGFSTNEFLND